MRCFLFCVLVLFGTGVYGQQPLGDLRFPLVSPKRMDVTLQQLKGKVVVLEFWATWCSGCIAAMPHLEELQRQYPDVLQVIAISDERYAKQKRFLDAHPFELWFASDSAGHLGKRFQHRIIPHTVLIGPAGNTVAVTEPRFITASVIERLLVGKSVTLPTKTDNFTVDPTADLFRADSSTQISFTVQPGITGASTMARIPNSGPFAGRRISMRNFTVAHMYMLAYRTSERRMVYDARKQGNAAEYCVDVIVPCSHPDTLYHTLIRKLHTAFDARAVVEKRMMDVTVLYRVDSTQALLKPSPTKTRYSARGDYFESSGATLDEFAEYLESFGLVDLPVVNDTQLAGTYVMAFNTVVGDRKMLVKALKAMGLGLREERREMEVLILSEQD